MGGHFKGAVPRDRGREKTMVPKLKFGVKFGTFKATVRRVGASVDVKSVFSDPADLLYVTWIQI
jgi:hypothetical protein